MAPLPQYQWLVVVGSLGAFAFGLGTGSNDVANTFGTSVGAKTLTLSQAVLIAAIFEFVGALVLGRVSTSTIAGGIADVATFSRAPEAYAYGMSCALATSAVWQVVCSYWEMNVSSTHSIIAAIMGFSFVWSGSNGVKWYAYDAASVPPYKGVVPILLSWIFSPIFTALVAAFILFLCRTLVLRRKNAVSLAVYSLPLVVTITLFINLYFVFAKGAKKTLYSDEWTDDASAWVAAACAGGIGVLVLLIVCPILFRRLRSLDEQGKDVASSNIPFPETQPDTAATTKAETASSDTASEEHVSKPSIVEVGKEEDKKVSENKSVEEESKTTSASWIKARSKHYWGKLKGAVLHGVSVDIHECVDSDPIVKGIHEKAEKFNPRAEFVFSWLQVFSAICVIFAHGSNDVGYMAGPLATIYDVYDKGALSKNVTPEIWVLVVSAIGLVIGLATYGYNVTRAMGTKMASLSPVRGFAAELATSFVILLCSQYGLPTSSSQCITGAIVGVGLLEGITSGVNWKFFGQQFLSWIGTIVIVAVSTGLLFAQGVYAPSVFDSDNVVVYENALSNITLGMAKGFGRELTAMQNASRGGDLPRLSYAEWSSLSSMMTNINKGSALNSTIVPDQLLSTLKAMLNVLVQQSVFTLGQTNVYPGVTGLCNNHTVCRSPPLR